MRRPHILKSNQKTGGYPSAIIAVDVETDGQPTDIDQPVIVTLKFGHAIYERSEKYSRRDTLDFTDADTFWDWAVSKTRQKTTLYICAHNAAFDMSVLQFEDMLMKRGWTVCLDKSVWPTDGQGPFWLTWRKENQKICLFNTGNLYPGTLETIGDAIGYKKMLTDISPEEKKRILEAQPGTDLWDTLTAYCRQDAEIVMQAMRVWANFCQTNDLGNFAKSLPGQADHAYRHRFMPCAIYIHNSQQALELERAAYYGGKTGCRYIGRWNKPIRVYDANSLYPSVMVDNLMPTRLLGVFHDCSVQAVNRYIKKGNLVITECEVEITREEDAFIPCRKDGRLIFPMGRFTTTICTPEYQEAVRLGLVKRVVRVAVYEAAVIFRDYVQFFYEKRLEYKRQGNETFAYMCKLNMNSLYGKFGQRTYTWHEIDWTSNSYQCIESGTETFDMPDGRTIHLRKLGDTIQERSEDRVEGINSFVAIAAHVTSYARMKLLFYERIAGDRGYLMFDTDSLFCTEEGAAKIEASGYVDANTLGFLKRESKGSETGGKINGPKDYEMDGHSPVCKGIRKDAIRITDTEYVQVQFRGVAGAARDHDINHVRLALIRKTLNREYKKGWIDTNGWTHPWVL